MTETPPADDRFEVTLDALGQSSRELVVARETIVQQQEEIEQLRRRHQPLRTKDEAVAQVARAFHLVRHVRLHVAQAEDALKIERAERTRLSHELASVTEQVGVLLRRLPNSTHGLHAIISQ